MDITGMNPAPQAGAAVTRQAASHSNGQAVFAQQLAAARAGQTAETQSGSAGQQSSPAESQPQQRQLSAYEELRDYMSLSDAEKIRQAVLEELGLSEEQFEALPPEEQLKIEQQIVERIKQQNGVDDSGFDATTEQWLTAGLQGL